MGRINRGDIPQKTTRIPLVILDDGREPLRFSFKYLDLTGNDKFGVHRCANEYLDRFLGRLRDVSQISVQEFRANRSSALKHIVFDGRNLLSPMDFVF